jgi:peptide deformylase
VTVRSILIDGQPALHAPTRRVRSFDPGFRELVADMFDTMYAGGGVGLAANQIGLSARVFVYDCPDADGNWHRGTVANPVLWTSSLPQRELEPESDVEGCMSVPLPAGFPLLRAEWAVVTGFNERGTAVEIAGSGVLARCFQHETDHLDGHLYLERLTDEYASTARDMVAERGWGAPGNSWLPDQPDGEASPVSRDIELPERGQRGPVSPMPVQIPAGIVLRPGG